VLAADNRDVLAVFDDSVNGVLDSDARVRCTVSDPFLGTLHGSDLSGYSGSGKCVIFQIWNKSKTRTPWLTRCCNVHITTRCFDDPPTHKLTTRYF
jgi:hypothetical protein